MTPLSCAAEATWEHGNSLINYMKMADINGITGRVKFDENVECVQIPAEGLSRPTPPRGRSTRRAGWHKR